MHCDTRQTLQCCDYTKTARTIPAKHQSRSSDTSSLVVPHCFGAKAAPPIVNQMILWLIYLGMVNAYWSIENILFDLRLAMRTAYDEMYAADGSVRESYRDYASWLQTTPSETLARKREEADIAFHRVGITFAVYGEDTGQERLIPFDIVPRIIPSHEWKHLADGLRQRVKALNAFLHDIYHDQDILKAGLIPAKQVLGNSQFRQEMVGVNVPEQVYAHIAGVDLVRADSGNKLGEYYVLEDNLRTPSGVSYMLDAAFPGVVCASCDCCGRSLSRFVIE
jgi:A circularly permuted ATPgrasp